MKIGLPGRWLCLVGLALASAPTVFTQNPPGAPHESPARGEVERLIQLAQADVSVAFRSLDGRQQLYIKADQQFPAPPAVIQLPIMIELFAEAGAGELRLSDTVEVHNSFSSIADGSVYHLDPKSDPDQDLYKSVGKPIALRDLCEHMMARNSSLAADLLIEELGVERIRQRIEALHPGGIQLIRGIEPEKPNDAKSDNTTSARGMLESLWTLAKGQEEDNDASKEMVGMMARAALSQPPTNGMPPDPRIAESVRLAGIGETAMIMYGPHPFVVVIVVRGMNKSEARTDLVALIEHALGTGLDATD
jgi:beta-lactamase class A